EATKQSKHRLFIIRSKTGSLPTPSETLSLRVADNAGDETIATSAPCHPILRGTSPAETGNTVLASRRQRRQRSNPNIGSLSSHPTRNPSHRNRKHCPCEPPTTEATKQSQHRLLIIRSTAEPLPPTREPLSLRAADNGGDEAIPTSAPYHPV